MEKLDHELQTEEEEEEAAEQPRVYVAYVQCSLCTTILWVGVPCSRARGLLRMATVRCGHCTALLSVCLPDHPTYFPFMEPNCTGDHHHMHVEALPNGNKLRQSTTDEGAEEAADEESSTSTTAALTHQLPLVNKPPEKRQRAPSTYNSFIREEIRRIKTRYPNISHKEAFSTAAKNWAHFPRIQHKSKSY